VVETLLALSDCQSQQKEQYLKEVTSDGKQGLRDLALAYRELPTSGQIDIPQYEQQLAFLGFVTLADPLRPTTKQTIERAESLGVAVKITPLPLQELAIVVGLALLYLVVLDVIKVQYYKRTDKDASKLLDVQPSTQAKH
jgi:P-type Mg2+ transporter